MPTSDRDEAVLSEFGCGGVWDPRLRSLARALAECREERDAAHDRAASLADSLNTHLREQGLSAHQVESVTDDMRDAVAQLAYQNVHIRRERDEALRRAEEAEATLRRVPNEVLGRYLGD